MKGTHTHSQSVTRIHAAAVESFMLGVLEKVGVRQDVARHVAAGLTETSLRGVDSHGIRLFPHYVTGAEKGRINRQPDYRFERTAAAAGVFDADHTYGHAACMEAMGHAMAIAGESGIGWVAVRNSSHAGAAACAALEAARRDFIGFTFLHADALLRTPGSTRPFFGTNPFCMAAPAEGEEPFCFDAAPTKISFNKVRQAREDNGRLPAGSAADLNGDETQDPHAATQLLPIGDYKGFGHAMVIDILCGLLTGMAAGRDISVMFKAPMSEPRRLGQMVIAVRVEVFQPLPLFKQRIRAMMEAVRREPVKEPGAIIQVPNDPEKRAAADRRANGIPVAPLDFQAFAALGSTYDVPWAARTSKTHD